MRPFPVSAKNFDASEAVDGREASNLQAMLVLRPAALASFVSGEGNGDTRREHLFWSGKIR